MRKLENGSRPAYLMAAVLLVAALAAPALAGTYYSWTTDDGTVSFTDDQKRIPARYKDAARRKSVGRLKDYPRYSESKVEVEKTHQERVEARLDGLRTRDVSAGPPGMAVGRAGVRVEQTTGIGDSTTRVTIPAGDASGSDEPVVTDEYRVKPANSIATRDITVTRQGDKVIAIQKAPLNARGISQDPDL